MAKHLNCLLASGSIALLSIVAQNSHAEILAISGDITLISPPASAQLEQLTNENQISGFSERQGLVLASDLSVSAVAPGAYGAAAGGSLVAGSVVSSYLFHADTLANLVSGTQMRATVTFDELVLGVVFERDLLNSSDVIFGSPLTSYAALDLDGGYRELELGGLSTCGASAFDCISIGSDRHSISFNFSVGQYIDEVRIITLANVPEPSTLLLSAMALAAVVRRQRHVV